MIKDNNNHQQFKEESVFYVHEKLWNGIRGCAGLLILIPLLILAGVFIFDGYLFVILLPLIPFGLLIVNLVKWAKWHDFVVHFSDKAIHVRGLKCNWDDIDSIRVLPTAKAKDPWIEIKIRNGAMVTIPAAMHRSQELLKMIEERFPEIENTATEESPKYH